MIILIEFLGLDLPFYFIADAYYASGKIVKKLLKNGNHLITRVKNNAVAYYPDTEKKTGRGRKRVYGEKIKLGELFKNPEAMVVAPSPVYGESNRQIRYLSLDLIWRPLSVDKTSVSLAVGYNDTISILGGTGYYTVDSTDSQVISAVIDGGSLEITGLSEGAATLNVKDSGGSMITISVTVVAAVDVSGNCGAFVAPGVWKEFDVIIWQPSARQAMMILLHPPGA